MIARTSPRFEKVLKISLLVLAVAVLGLLAYRYYHKPVQTWAPDTFEGRNPDKVETKNQGQQYWRAEAPGNGFYVTDETVSSGDKKVYCVSGAVATSAATFSLGDSTASVKNGFFTHCASLTVNDKRQLNFTLTDGGLQIYRIERKR